MTEATSTVYQKISRETEPFKKDRSHWPIPKPFQSKMPADKTVAMASQHNDWAVRRGVSSHAATVWRRFVEMVKFGTDSEGSGECFTTMLETLRSCEHYQMHPVDFVQRALELGAKEWTFEAWCMVIEGMSGSPGGSDSDTTEYVNADQEELKRMRSVSAGQPIIDETD